MTLADLYATGKYQDFILIDDLVYLVPTGFILEPSPVETSTIKTMADGTKRQDVLRSAYKYKFSWDSLGQAGVSALTELYQASLSGLTIKLFLKKENPADVTDYDIITLSIVSMPASKPKSRFPTAFWYGSVALEVE